MKPEAGLTSVTGVTEGSKADEDENGFDKASNGKGDNLDTATIVKPADQTITLTLSRYDELVSELAALKNQREYLLEYKVDAETIRGTVFEQEHKIGRLEGELTAVHAELAKRKLSFWRRLWSRAQTRG
jgi:hypothetical protein